MKFIVWAMKKIFRIKVKNNPLPNRGWNGIPVGRAMRFYENATRLEKEDK